MKAVIIGAGSIGALKPDKFDSPKTENVLTLAHAFYNNPNCELYGIIDINSKKAEQAAEKWETQYFFVNVTLSAYIDIYAVAVPTKNHYEVLKQVIERNPKIIIAEKPFCENTEQAIEIERLAKEKGIMILVDYIRRWAAGYQKFVTDLHNNKFGKVLNVVLKYTRGLEHEGCHALDLFNWFFGQYITGEMLFDPIMDNPPELTLPGILSFRNAPRVFMVPMDGREYAIFEIDIYTTAGVFSFVDHGKELHVRKKTKEATYGNYDCLSRKTISDTFNTGLEKALSNLVMNAVAIAEGKGDVNFLAKCTAKDAINTHIILDKLLKRRVK